MAYRLIKSKGAPEYAVWVKARKTERWHCWGQVHSPDDYPDLLNDINSGKYFNSNYTETPDYIDIKYLPNDGKHCPN